MAILPVPELHKLGMQVLENAQVPSHTSESVTRALVAAEMDGIPSHGFSRLPFYLDQVSSGKIHGQAQPSLMVNAPTVIMVDAGFGFAYPALDIGLKEAGKRAQEFGTCALGVTRSHHCGTLGYHVERCALAGFTALAFANTPAGMAPWGGSKACFGTNPIAFACPREKSEMPLVIDLSLSKVARGKVVMARKKGQPIPEGWALDAGGNPTTDPDEALKGTMTPMGEAKGSALALMVEILAAGLTGANFAADASSMFEAEGPPPGIGQFLVLFKTAAFSPDFSARIEMLFTSMTAQEGVRLPGDRRIQEREKRLRDGVEIDDGLLRTLREQY